MRKAIAVLSGLALAACQMSPGSPAAPAPTAEDPCGAAAFADLVGEPAGLQDWSALDQPVRVIPPGSAVTMDHRPDRLNVDVNRDGDVARLWCG